MLVLDAGFKRRHHQPGSVQRPSQIGKKQDDGLHPTHFEQLHTHVSHLRKEVGQKADHLSVEPFDDLIHDGSKNKVPDKHWILTPFCGNKKGTP